MDRWCRRVTEGVFAHGVGLAALFLAIGLGLFFHQRRRRVFDRLLSEQTARRERAEAELRSSERNYRTLIDSSPDAIVVHRDGRRIFANPAAVRLFAASCEQDLIGRPFLDTIRPEFHGFVLDRVERILHAGEAATVAEVGLFRLDGSPVDVESHAELIDYDGRPAVRVSMHDITARRRAEAQLRSMAATLEAKVAERTEQLRAVSAQLTMAEERERRILAEELHDNLGQVLATLKILLAEPVAAEGARVRQLVDLAEQLTRAVTLKLSPPVLNPLGLLPALRWLGEEMQRMHGLVVHVDSEGEVRPVAREMGAILYRSARELLVNVAKHARTGEASIFCQYEPERLILTVRDDGRGFAMPPAGPASGRADGFGLNSIRERFTSLGGETEIDSAPGLGTTVVLTTPYAVTTTLGQRA